MKRSLIIILSAIIVCVLCYSQRIKNIPSYALVFYDMGIHCGDECGSEAQLLNFQKAIQYSAHLKEARFDPLISDACYRMGLIYQERGDDARAVDSFKKAIDFYQQNTLAYYELGLYYFKQNDSQMARRYFLRTVKSRRGRPDDTYYYLAKIHDDLKMYYPAISYYNEIVILRPEYADEMYPRLAELYYYFDHDEKMENDLDWLRELGRDDLVRQLERYYRVVQKSNIQR